jgi:hypothetical protein
VCGQLTLKRNLLQPEYGRPGFHLQVLITLWLQVVQVVLHDLAAVAVRVDLKLPILFRLLLTQVTP